MISIIGAGYVGATLAKRILENNLADIVLLDIVKGVAEGKALDLLHAGPIIGYTRTIRGTNRYQDIKDSRIVVITAGFSRRPGMSREDLTLKNSRIVKEISVRLKRFCPDAVVIVVTNPLDIMTYITYRETGFKRSKVIGMGGVLDTSRFTYLISKEKGLAASKIETMVLGSHSDAMVPLISQTMIEKRPITKLFSDKKIAELIERTKRSGAEVVRLLGSGSAFYAPSAACFLMIKSIVKDERKIFPASVFLDGEYGLNGLCMGVPVRLGKDGVEEIVELKITDEEKNALQTSAKEIRKGMELVR